MLFRFRSCRCTNSASAHEALRLCVCVCVRHVISVCVTLRSTAGHWAAASLTAAALLWTVSSSSLVWVFFFFFLYPSRLLLKCGIMRTENLSENSSEIWCIFIPNTCSGERGVQSGAGAVSCCFFLRLFPKNNSLFLGHHRIGNLSHLVEGIALLLEGLSDCIWLLYFPKQLCSGWI